MTQRNDCTEILDLIPEYAFGLTDEVTSRRIEAALPTCPEAAQQLAELHRLQADMRESVHQVAPPPALASRLREAIRLDSESAPSMTVRPPAEPVDLQRGVVVPDVKRARGEQQTASRSTPNTSGRRSIVFPLVAVAALIALVITNVYWFSRVNSLSSQVENATTLLAQFQNDTFSVRDASTLELARLAGGTEGSFAMMMWDQGAQTGLIYTRDFPEVQPDRVYQLWLLRGDERISGGTFSVTEEGEGAMIFTAPDAISNFEAAGITEEPAGGSDEPTSSPFVSGAL